MYRFTVDQVSMHSMGDIIMDVLNLNSMIINDFKSDE